MSFAPDLNPSILEAILNNSDISSKLANFSGSKSIHTRKPVPAGAGYMMVTISPDISSLDDDATNSFRSVIVKDISVYGKQPDDYRNVEDVGRKLRELFHRKRRSIAPEDCHVVSVTATGPIPSPTDDEKIVGRTVTVTFVVQPQP